MAITSSSAMADSKQVMGRLPSISASTLKNRMGEALAMARGEGIAITRHDRAEFVLLTASKYLELQQSREAPLEALTAHFDAMVEKMNRPETRRGVAEFFSSTPEELGLAALNAAQNDVR